MRESQQDSSEEKEEARDADPDIEAQQGFWNIMRDYMYRNLVAPRTKLYVPKDDFPIPLIWIRELTLTFFMRQPSTIIGMLMKTSLTRFELFNKNPPGGQMWVRGRLTKKQVTARLGNIRPEEWSSMPKGSERKALNKWADWTLRENNRYLLHSGRWPWFWGNHEVFGRDGI